jgi:hypothetical protein
MLSLLVYTPAWSLREFLSPWLIHANSRAILKLKHSMTTGYYSEFMTF